VPAHTARVLRNTRLLGAWRSGRRSPRQPAAAVSTTAAPRRRPRATPHPPRAETAARVSAWARPTTVARYVLNTADLAALVAREGRTAAASPKPPDWQEQLRGAFGDRGNALLGEQGRFVVLRQNNRRCNTTWEVRARAARRRRARGCASGRAAHCRGRGGGHAAPAWPCTRAHNTSAHPWHARMHARTRASAHTHTHTHTHTHPITPTTR
jgi:hypothetical protein